VKSCLCLKKRQKRGGYSKKGYPQDKRGEKGENVGRVTWKAQETNTTTVVATALCWGKITLEGEGDR